MISIKNEAKKQNIKSKNNLFFNQVFINNPKNFKSNIFLMNSKNRDISPYRKYNKQRQNINIKKKLGNINTHQVKKMKIEGDLLNGSSNIPNKSRSRSPINSSKNINKQIKTNKNKSLKKGLSLNLNKAGSFSKQHSKNATIKYIKNRSSTPVINRNIPPVVKRLTNNKTEKIKNKLQINNSKKNNKFNNFLYNFNQRSTTPIPKSKISLGVNKKNSNFNSKIVSKSPFHKVGNNINKKKDNNFNSAFLFNLKKNKPNNKIFGMPRSKNIFAIPGNLNKNKQKIITINMNYNQNENLIAHSNTQIHPSFISNATNNNNNNITLNKTNNETNNETNNNININNNNNTIPVKNNKSIPIMEIQKNEDITIIENKPITSHFSAPNLKKLLSVNLINNNNIIPNNTTNNNIINISDNINNINQSIEIFKPQKIKKKIRCMHELSKTGYAGEDEKKINQDNYFIFNNFVDHDKIFMSVCDGHGAVGQEISNFLKENLPIELNHAIKNSNKNILTDDLTPIITKIFNKINLKLTSNEMINSLLSGSTCVSLIYTPYKLITANVGDSRAFLGKHNEKLKKWFCYNLTEDHKPNLEKEKQRILKMGGRIEPIRDFDGSFIGADRVWVKNGDYPGLAMSRSFGDQIAHSVGVSVEPDIKIYEFKEEDKFFVLASDGLFEFIDGQKIVEIIGEYYEKGDIVDCCEYLYKVAREKWLMEEEVVDDITIILVFLDEDKEEKL